MRRQTEEQNFQKAVVRYIRLTRKDIIVFSVRNEGKRSKAEASIAKATGLTSGVSDLVLIGVGKILFLELKSEKGKLTKNQILFKEEVEKRGFQYQMSKSIDEIIKIVSEF